MTNGHVERMSRTIKEATIRRCRHDDHSRLQGHPGEYINGCNFGRRLKTFKGLTPCGLIRKQWTPEPEGFTLKPIRQMPGSNHQIMLPPKTQRGGGAWPVLAPPCPGFLS